MTPAITYALNIVPKHVCCNDSRLSVVLDFANKTQKMVLFVCWN